MANFTASREVVHYDYSEKTHLLTTEQPLPNTATIPPIHQPQFPLELVGKHVLLATESLGPINGVSRTTGSLIEYLRNNNVNVTVVAPEIGASKARTSQSAYADLRLHGWPLPYNPDLTIAYPFRLDKIFERTANPDVIYLASPASVGFQILLQVRQLGHAPPVLCNFQTDLSAYGEIIFPAGMNRYAVWMLGFVQGYLFKAAAVRTVFYPCSDIKRYLNSTGLSNDKLVRLGRGVDTVLFDPLRRDEIYRKELAPNGETILICVSRLAPEKGFAFLAEAVKRLAERSVRFKLVVVGGNRNPAVQAEVEKYFTSVKANVVFTGFLTGTALARAYAAADLFLHCSITETFGLVVLEAMASGVPVIARDQGGPSEIVLHEKTGYLVAPNDMDCFVSRVERLCKDSDLRSLMSATCRQAALDTTWEKINNRAAWYIADSLRQSQQQSEFDFDPKAGHYSLTRATSRLSRQLLLPILIRLKLWAAVGVVTVFWAIACLPLIIHGSLFFHSA